MRECEVDCIGCMYRVRQVVGGELAYSRESCTVDTTLCREITCASRKLYMGRDGFHVGAWTLTLHES
jgi:hypothetical protein